MHLKAQVDFLSRHEVPYSVDLATVSKRWFILNSYKSQKHVKLSKIQITKRKIAKLSSILCKESLTFPVY